MDQFEKTVCDLNNRMATRFMGYVLSQADEMIRADGRRKRKYAIQRKNQRALISSVGDVSYTHTLYKDKKTGEYVYLLDDLMHMVPHERMTPVAEAKALAVSAVHSYQHAADMVSTTTQTITKTTVMNKVHSMEEQLPDMEPEVSEKKKCEYLYIEADEDHIHRQKDGHEEGCMIGKLAYLFEGKEEECKGRNRLIGVHYFGGLYPGDENVRFWEGVQEYIEKHYDMDHLKRVYINSDGGAWIKASKNYIYKSVLVADRFHLMKYINRVCNLSGDKKDAYKQRFYKYIWKNKLLAAKKLLGRIRTLSDNIKAVDDCQAYFENNWKAIQKAFHDKNVYGCSAEGHVSNVLSDRMSSRPMGWSEKALTACASFVVMYRTMAVKRL